MTRVLLWEFTRLGNLKPISSPVSISGRARNSRLVPFSESSQYPAIAGHPLHTADSLITPGSPSFTDFNGFPAFQYGLAATAEVA